MSSLKSNVDLNLNSLDEESKGITMNEETEVDVLRDFETYDREDDQLVSTDDILLAIEVENG